MWIQVKRVNFMGFLEMGGFPWFHEICESHGNMHGPFHGAKFYCGLQNFIFYGHLFL